MAREKSVTEGNPKEPEQILLPGSAAKKIFESTGENYFRTITEVIVREMDLGLDYCVVAELVGGGKVRTIAFYAVDRFIENAEYSLEETPCRFVVGRKPCIYLRNVQKLFPEALLLTQMQAQSYIGVPLFSSDGSPLGLMAALGRRPLPQDKQERITALLQILAAGVVGELERKRKEDALRTSEENYRAVFDSANDGIFIHDFKTGDVVSLNRKASEMYGYSLEEFRHFINESLFTGVPGYTAQDAMKRIQSAAQGPPQVFEWLSRKKDGRLFWVEVNLKRAVIGGETRLLAIVRDITERKRSEEAMKLTQFSVDHASVSAFLIGKDARILYVNEQACRTLGYTCEELLMMTVVDIDPDVLPSGWPDLWDRLKKEGSLHLERIHRRKDGTLFPVEITANYVSFGGREYNWAFAIDISERKKAELRLHESEERFRQLAENTDQVFWFTEADPERVLYVSPAYERIWGHRAGDLYANPRWWLAAVHPEDRHRVEAAFVDWTSRKSPRYDIEYRIVRADGAVRWIRDRGTLIRDAGGRVVRLSGIADDITDRKKAEQEIRRAKALLEEAQHIAGIGNWEWDLRTNKLTGSDEVYRILNIRPDQFKGTYEAFLEMVHPEDRPILEKRLAEAFHVRKETSQNDYRVILRGGEIRILNLRSRFQYDRAGGLIGIRGTAQDVTEARWTEETLKLTQFSVDHAAVSAFIIDRDARILYANEQACRTSGYSHQELLSMTIPDLDPNFPHTRWDGHWEQLKKEGGFLHFESVHRRKDGTLIPMDISVNYLSFRGREYNVGFALDVSERKKAEQQLLESEERFRQLAENTKQVFWFMTPEPERVLYVSPAFESIWGLRADELYRNPGLWAEVIHPDDRDAVEKAFREWASGMSERFDIEYRIVRPDGGIRWILSRGTIIRDALGRVVRLSGIADDITDRKRIEQEIEKTKAQLEEAQQIAGIGNWEWDKRTNKITWSAELYRIFNMRQGEFKGTFEAFMERVHPDDGPRMEKYFAEAAAERKESSFNEYRIIRPDGKERILYTRSRFLYDNAGELIGMRGTAQDVTEARRTEEALKITQFSVDHAAVSAFLVDRDSRLRYVNEEACRTLGYTREELLMMSVPDLDPHASSDWEDHWRQLKRRGRVHYERMHRKKDGTFIPVEISGNYVSFGGREYNWAFAVDISERKRAENSLSQSYQLTKTIIDSINDPISLIDVRDFTLVRVNKVFLERYGYSDQSEVTGKHCYEITHHRPDVCSAPDDICPLLETVKTREHFAVDHVHYDRRGEKIYVEVSTSPIRDEAGNVIQVVHVQRDVTERKRAEEALRLSEARFRNLFKQSSLSMQILSPDGSTLEVNHAWEELWGLKPEAIKDYNILHDRQLIAKGSMPYIQKGFAGEATEVPVVFYDPSEIEYAGQGRWVKGFIYPVKTGDGRIHELVLMHMDVTESIKAEEALRESEERFRAFFELAGVGAAQLNPVTGRFLRVNDRFCAITGYSREEMLSRTFEDITHPDDREADSKFFARVVSGEAGEYDAEKRYVHKDGRTVWVHVSSTIIRDKDGRPVMTAGIVQDITERKRMEEEIRHMAHHDALTGLPNRRLFMDIISIELAQAHRGKKKVGVLFLDLDRFKEINDTLGHETGDLLLKQVASRLKAILRKSDSISRIGGDEFNIVLADIARAEDISDIARKLVGGFKKPFSISGHELRVSASVGISIYPDDSDEIDALLRFSDMAMYHAKESGKNTYSFYDPSINIRSIERMRLENMLLRSLELDEMGIYYQPQINISDRRIVCAEALIRWNHPQRGLLLPKDFIPLAEETGFIAAIDEFVLTTVCRQLRAWRDAGLPRLCVTVNLSSRQFESAELIDKVRSILKETGMPAGCLDIEISESMAMSDVERSADRMRQLAGMGIHISIDDFGTGYSSLNYLKRLPIEKLKIDKSFIQDITVDRDDRAIVNAVTLMAHTMNLKVVAEGVEDEAQLEFLRNVKCDEAQGFLISRPLTPEEFAKQLVETK